MEIYDSDDSDEGSTKEVSVTENNANGLQMENHVSVKKGQIITYVDSNSGQKCVALVKGKAGKATGKNKNWFNLKYTEPETLKDAEISVDLAKVDGLECVESENNSSDLENNVMMLEDISFTKAKANELDSWKKNGVYMEQKDTGQKCISTRWICSLKETSEGIKHKARLVARGFEESQIEEIPKDSPTCDSESLRVVLAVLAQRGWKPCTMDIKTAFLQGSGIERNLFIKPPKEANCNGTVWKLQKCVYGLVDASLHWYYRVCEVFEKCGGKVSKNDPAVFFWKDDKGNIEGVLACHVDDFLWGGSKRFEQNVISKIRSSFQVGQECSSENGTFPYVGIEVSSSKGEIKLKQERYLTNIHPISVDKERTMERESELTQTEKDALQSKIGQILWIARQSRPDVIFDASNVASSFKGATVQTLIDANKVIKNLKSDNVTLKFQQLGSNDKLKIVIFSDSSLGNLSNGGTQGGHFIMLAGEDGHFSPLTWQSKRIKRVVRSTIAGETLALAEAVDNGVFLATLYMELITGTARPERFIPITCITDNHSLYEAIKSTKYVSEKRLRIEISGIKELLKSGQIKEVKWIETKCQLADCLTKKGASPMMLLRALDSGRIELAY